MKTSRTTFFPLVCLFLALALPALAEEAIPAPPDVAVPAENADFTATGLASVVLRPGTGSEHARVVDSVTVHYTGWTVDGKMFDSSKGEPSTFSLDRKMAGWIEGLQLMVVGEKRRFWIPEALAYRGRRGRPAGMLVFDIELLSIEKAPGVPDDVAAPPEDAEVTDSGLASKVLTVGQGSAHPAAEDKVTVHYSGWTTDGKQFDSSTARGKPSSFTLNRVISGWTEGLQLMVVGEKRRFWIPQELAYKGQFRRPRGMLVFDIELLEITEPPEPPEPPEVPRDVAAPPEDAETTDSGVASKVLKAGTGTVHPQATSRVRVHYSGWTTDGKMFDSSVARGQPSTFGLNQVIAGWTEGLQLMVVGEKRRLWIPEKLAYGGRAGSPQGMLVFDVELLEIVSQ